MDQLSESQKLAFKNTFIKFSFRDMADRDYITARICYRYGLDFQFHWFAQQAVEKYLKAILLYNEVSAKGLSHSIYTAYKKVIQIKDIKFDFPEDIEKFIKHLNLCGNNRYFEFSLYIDPDDMMKLDRIVWYIRRYCQYIRGSTEISGKTVEMLPIKIGMIQNKYYFKKPNLFIIPGGYLEDILRNKKSKQRAYLVWKNFYYGSYSKKKIKNWNARFHCSNPIHLMHEQIFPELDKIVDFSKSVKEYFRKRQESKG